MIIQSSNKPTLIKFSENMENVDEIRITLWNNEKELKLWTKEDVIIHDDVVECPLTQQETSKFPTGILELEIKWYSDGYTHHSERIKVSVSSRNDLTEMGVQND